ncbi:hypothetical protein B0H13DRAFT_2354414 [Mycena leptocephala]|nr:hypothetical protein B0H13DRAFT_2354414 [Mycena leptocephala]
MSSPPHSSTSLLSTLTHTQGSCGGFSGISDSFTAALWGLDYAQFRRGDPFTSAPTNESSFHQWSVGAVYYSVVIMAEAIDPSNETQASTKTASPCAWRSSATSTTRVAPTPCTPSFPSRDDAGEREGEVPGGDDGGAKGGIAKAGGIRGRGRCVAFCFFFSISLPILLDMPPRDRTSLLPLLRAYPIADDAAQTFGGNFESDGRPTGTLDIKSVRSIDFMRATNGLTCHGAPQSTVVATALADASDLIISASVHGACASSSPSATGSAHLRFTLTPASFLAAVTALAVCRWL